MVRLAHFTDLHITARPGAIPWKYLLGKRCLGWLNLSLGGRADVFADAADVARALVHDLETHVHPDHIVSTGDFTGLALPGEFAAVRQALAPLLQDERVISIPGNHDVYVPSAVRDRLYEQALGGWTRTDFTVQDLPRELGDLYPYPLVRFLGDEAVLVCLRDVHANPPHDSTGRVGRRQLQALQAVLANPRLAGRFKILALHYGLCRADRSPDTRLHGLRDARELIHLAERGGVGLVLHGHLHGRFLLPAATGWPFVIANPGSVSSRKPHHQRAYHVVTVAGDHLCIQARRYDTGRAEFVAWPEVEFHSAIYTSRAHE